MEYSFDHRRYMSISPVNSDEFAGEIAVDARELQKSSDLRTAWKGDLGGERRRVRALQGARRKKLDCSLRAVVRVQWSGRVGEGRGECEGGIMIGKREWSCEKPGIE